MKSQIVIASMPDKEKLVAELYWDDVMWAELSNETGVLKVRTWGKESGEPWEIPLQDVLGALSEAKKKLVGK